MVHIVGVHGIGQGRTSPERLSKKWMKALQRGTRELAAPDDSPIDLVVPHWAPHLKEHAQRLEAGDDPFGMSEPMNEEEASFIAQTCEDTLDPQVLAYADRLPEDTLGVPGLPQVWPAHINKLVKAMDNKNPGHGEWFVKLLREVRHYLHEPELAQKVRQYVVLSWIDRSTVLLGHSLGSVIAYDLIRRGELPSVEKNDPFTLITCGSPLGLPTVRRALGLEEDEPLEVPAGVRWVNVYDRGDLVTGGEGLNQSTVITDVPVDNGRWNRHGSGPYLRTIAVAEALAAAGRV
ncbi:hypothetical protein ACIQFP_09410 [Nocardiopsis alba]|uniref:hypothetical protein n=1 Tax=Nocardiopsis alba TaxID=53437 RepID=UPI0033D3D24B